MAHKVNISEVISLSDKTKKASSEVSTDLELTKSNVGLLNEMDSFSGRAAKSAKNYLNEFHLSVLGSFDTLFTSIDLHLQDHIETFHGSVDSSESAIIQSEYLESVKQDLEIEYENLEGTNRSVKRAIEKVTDIAPVTTPTFSEIVNSYRETTKFIDEVDKDLNSFTKKGKSDNSKTKDLIEKIEVVMRKANATKGEDRFTDYKHGTQEPDIVALNNIVDYTDKGMDAMYARLEDKANQRNPKPQKDPGVNAKNNKVSIWSKAKNVGKSFVNEVKQSGKNMIGMGKHLGKTVTGPLGGGLNYYDNLNEAYAHDQSGVDAHVYAAEDTAVDVAMGAGVAVAAGAAVAAAAPLLGVGALAATATVGATILGNMALDAKIFNGESAKDKVKKGYRKVKGWLFGS